MGCCLWKSESFVALDEKIEIPKITRQPSESPDFSTLIDEYRQRHQPKLTRQPSESPDFSTLIDEYRQRHNLPPLLPSSEPVYEWKRQNCIKNEQEIISK